MRLIGMLVGLGLTIVVGACGASEPAPSDAGMIDANGHWQLADGMVDGVRFQILDDAPITMTVAGATISGRAACNHYGGVFLVEGGRVRLALTSMTARACAEPAMAAEAAFDTALGRIDGATRDGDRLILSGPDVELTFERRAAD